MRERDPAADALCTALRDVTGHSEAEDDPCVAIDLPDDYETYLAGLSSKFRQRLRQRTNKLLRTCEVRFFPTAAVEDLDEHLGLLFAMHQRRWELEKRVGAFADPRMREFYRKAATSLLAADRLWFWHLEVDGVIRASQFAFAYDGVLHSLQEGYDIDFSLPGVSGLGVILRGRVLRAAIEAGLSKYDFLGGEEEHKLRWGARRHTVRRFRAARHGIGGRAAWLTTVAGERVRERAKALIPDAALEQLRVARDQRRRKRLAAGTRQAGSRSD